MINGKFKGTSNKNGITRRPWGAVKGRLWVCCSDVWLWWAESTAGSVPCLVCPVHLLRDSPVAVQTLLQVAVLLLV